MGVSSANCVSGFPLPLSFPVPTGSVSWEAFHPLALAVRVLRGFGFRFWTFPLGCSHAATRPPFSLWGLRPCALCARSFRRLGVLCRFRICGVCASKRIPTSEFSLDLESRFADFRVLGPSRWLPVDGESVRTRFPPGSIAFWRLCAPVLCFCLCPPKFCASRFGKKQVYGKRVPVVFFVWFLGVLRRVSADTAPEAAIFPLCLCRSIVGFFRSSGCCVLRVFRASAPALPPIPASPEEFRFQGFLLIGRAASLALLLGLPPAVFSPSDDFFELPLSRSLMQPLCCIRIKHTLSRLLRGQFPEAVGTLPLAISAFSPFAIGSAPFPFSCLYYSMPFAVCQQESFCVYLLCIYNYLRALPTSKFP